MIARPVPVRCWPAVPTCLPERCVEQVGKPTVYGSHKHVLGEGVKERGGTHATAKSRRSYARYARSMRASKKSRHTGSSPLRLRYDPSSRIFVGVECSPNTVQHQPANALGQVKRTLTASTQSAFSSDVSTRHSLRAISLLHFGGFVPFHSSA
jgi:hypothetical protein